MKAAPLPRSAVSTVLTLLVLLPLLAGCGYKEPFKYVRVSGKVTYEDGTPIPLDGLILTFISQSPPVDAKTYPRPGVTFVDKKTGKFHAVTSHKANDGLVRVEDARWGKFYGCVPADHNDEIGQVLGDSPGIGNDWDHQQFYADVVALLRDLGL